MIIFSCGNDILLFTILLERFNAFAKFNTHQVFGVVDGDCLVLLILIPSSCNTKLKFFFYVNFS